MKKSILFLLLGVSFLSEVKAQISITAFPSTEVCEGTTVILTASGATNLWWNGNYNYGAILTVTPGATNTYTVYGVVNGVQTYANITITVHQKPTTPTFSITSNNNCGPAVLTIQNYFSPYCYLWENGDTNQVRTVFTTGTYSVTVFNDYGCSSSSSVNVTANPIPVANAGPDPLPVCLGESVVLSGITVPNANGYCWAVGNSLYYTQGISIVPPVGTNYYGSAVRVGNCWSPWDTLRVVVNPKPAQPTFTVTSNNNCGPAVLTIQNYFSPYCYLWENGDTNQVRTVFTTGTYSVTVFNDYGCSSSSSVNVTANPIPVANAGPDPLPVCLGDAVSLNAVSTPGASSYCWSMGASYYYSQSISFQLPVGSYNCRLAVQVGGCWSPWDTAVAVVNSNPATPILVTNPTSGIGYDSVKILVSNYFAPYHYQWIPGGDTTSSITAFTSGVYLVNVSNEHGCSESATKTVVVVLTTGIEEFSIQQIREKGLRVYNLLLQQVDPEYLSPWKIYITEEGERFVLTE